jgi:hypothetical protein
MKKRKEFKTPPQSRRSKKSKTAPAEGDEDQGERRFSCVKMRLISSESLYENLRAEFLSVLQRCVTNVNRMAFEAYHLILFHIIRCSLGGIAIPDLNDRNALQNFIGRACSAVTDGTRECADPDLAASADEFVALRPGIGYKAPTMKNFSKFKDSLRMQMETAVKNHIVEGFLPRLLRYVRLRYDLPNKKSAEYFLNRALASEGERTADQIALGEWLGFDVRYKDLRTKHMNRLLEKMMEMLAFMEGLDPDTKGKKTFTLLPTKKDYVLSHVQISNTVMIDVLSQLTQETRTWMMSEILKEDGIHEDVRALLEDAVDKKTAFTREILGDPVVIKTIWSMFFNYKKFETCNRKFAYGVSTNGYEVMLRFTKPGDVRDKGSEEDDAVKKFGEEEDTEFDAIPVNLAEYDRFVGIDPGRTFLATGYSEDLKDGSGDEHVSISTKRYRHMAKMHKETKWRNHLRRREARYQDIIRDMPSLKTMSLDNLKEAIRYRLKHAEFLFEFCKKKPFRRWRFTTFVCGEKAMVELAKEIVKGGSKKTLVGFGDWSQQDGFLKGSPKAPVKKFKRVLRRYATVVKIDEYNTSQVCSACWEGKVKKVMFKDREGNLSECHQVVRCSSSACTKCWQRDENASRNIFNILKAKLMGKERPFPFRRPSRQQTNPRTA